MFSKNYEFRYGDLDKSNSIKPSAVLDILQDAAIEHASISGLDAEFLNSQSIAFLLDGWRLKFIKPLCRNSKVTVKTGIIHIRKCETLRKFEIFQDDECKAIVTSMWFAINTEKRSIARLSDEFYSGFDSINEEDNGLEYTNIRPIKNADFCGSYTVARRDTDTNNHMNNVKSVELLLDYLPEDFHFTELQIKYRKEILPGEEIKIYSCTTENEFYLEIRNSEDKPSVIIIATA